jgi:hypothetical protein
MEFFAGLPDGTLWDICITVVSGLLFLVLAYYLTWPSLRFQGNGSGGQNLGNGRSLQTFSRGVINQPKFMIFPTKSGSVKVTARIYDPSVDAYSAGNLLWSGGPEGSSAEVCTIEAGKNVQVEVIAKIVPGPEYFACTSRDHSYYQSRRGWGFSGSNQHLQLHVFDDNRQRKWVSRFYVKNSNSHFEIVWNQSVNDRKLLIMSALKDIWRAMVKY